VFFNRLIIPEGLIMDEQTKCECCVAKDVRIPCSGGVSPEPCLCDAHYILFDWWSGMEDGSFYLWNLDFSCGGGTKEDRERPFIEWMKGLSDEEIEKIRNESGEEVKL